MNGYRASSPPGTTVFNRLVSGMEFETTGRARATVSRIEDCLPYLVLALYCIILHTDVDDSMIYVETMMIDHETYRPIAGGTKEGVRLLRYDYWRTGYGAASEKVPDMFVAQAGEYHCKAGYVSGDYEFTPRYQFFYHKDGEALFECRGATARLGRGDLLMVPASEIYSYTSSGGVKYHWFALEGRWPTSLCPDHWQKRSVGWDAVLESILIGMRESLIMREPGYELRALGYFYEFMARVEELGRSNLAGESEYPEAVRNAMMFLRENCDRPFSAAQAAAAVGISQSHLRALFRRWLGESPQSYHTRCRIEQAKRLLREHRLLVFEVAYQVGYKDVRYFARVFKKVTGLTPSQYARA
ncbi:MAG: AraC family transcriptional regulator [Caldilineae bacterium]|nr:MAG: AraC family transcriptional regulator [Caldilineae bacterium]